MRREPLHLAEHCTHVRIRSYIRYCKARYAESNNILVNKVRHEFRQIFFEMGFEEMPTNWYCYVS